MAVQFRDYYETLGVSRTASHDDIRTAYRKLARKYHPDVAKDKAAGEEKFKEINEAYEVLGDPEKRRKYDALGADWQQGQEFRPPPGSAPEWQWRRGEGGGFEFHMGGTGFSDFFETLFGTRRPFGRGDSSGEYSAPQPGAEPFGEYGRDIEGDIMVTLEEALKGSTRQISLQRLSGEGGQTKTESYTVKIPSGIREGQRIRLAGRGEAGGDLFLRVRFERHPDFRVQESDLYYDLELAPWEAVLGSQVTIPTLAGRAKLKIPAGTQAGHKFRLNGQGLPRKGGGRGQLYAVVTIQTPPKVSEAERQLWERLSGVSTFNPRL
ncbi:MAG: J domain-containing protein [Chthoniobacterales bacterium]